jgi:hypothetical protein
VIIFCLEGFSGWRDFLFGVISWLGRFSGWRDFLFEYFRGFFFFFAWLMAMRLILLEGLSSSFHYAGAYVK